MLHLAALIALNRMPAPRTPQDTDHVRLTSVFFPLPPSRPVAAAPAPLPSPRAPLEREPILIEDPAPFPSATPPPVTAPPPLSTSAENAVTPGAADIMAQARRDIGKIERSLRGKLPPIPDDEDLLRARLGQAIANAARGGAGIYLASYTAPDGVVITRKTVGNGSACFMSGTVNYMPGILHDASRAQPVKCPKGVTWKAQ